MKHITGLIGRDELVERVAREARKGRHLLLTGRPGVGKSTVLEAVLDRLIVRRYLAIGTWKGGFIVLHQGQPRAVGKSEVYHNLLPISARLIEGEPLAVQSEKVEMKGRTLRWLLSKIDQRRVYYLSGEIQTAKVEPVANIDRYQPVIYSGQTMTLRYARAQELGPWLDLVAAKGVRRRCLCICVGVAFERAERAHKLCRIDAQQQAAVAGRVAAAFGGRQQPLHFRRHQIAAFEQLTVYSYPQGGSRISNG